MKNSLLKYSELPDVLLDRWKSFCVAGTVYDSPFYAPQFTRAVAQVREDVRIAVFERGGDVIGFLPFHLTRSGNGKPIGGQLNDYQGPILMRGQSLSAAELLDGAQIRSYDYNHLPASFTALSEDAHLFSSSPRMDLSSGYGALIERKGRDILKARRDVERCRRKTAKDVGELEFSFNEFEAATYAKHVDLKNALYERTGTTLRLGNGWIDAVLKAIAETEESEFSGVFSTLHAGGTLIAAHFGIRSANVLHWWFPSYELKWKNLGPGINLLDYCAASANQFGISVIDFGRGSGGYKTKFADSEIGLCEGSVSRPGSLAQLVRKGAHSLVAASEKLPLGKFQSYPGRALSKALTGVALSSPDRSLSQRTGS